MQGTVRGYDVLQYTILVPGVLLPQVAGPNTTTPSADTKTVLNLNYSESMKIMDVDRLLA